MGKLTVKMVRFGRRALGLIFGTTMTTFSVPVALGAASRKVLAAVPTLQELHWGSRGTPCVRSKTVSKLKPKFTAYPLMKLKFSGVFELLSVRAVHWYACYLPKVKLQKLRSEKHAFGLPVERRKEGSQGP